MSEVALSNGGWDLEEIGHQLRDPALTYERYAQICRDLGYMHYAVGQASAAIKFAIGDAVLLGEQVIGQEAFQAIEEMQVSEQVRSECVRIARQVPRSRRRLKTLTWSHHRAVAALEPAAQKEWLKAAEEQNLSHHALREALREGAPPEPRTRCRCCGRELLDQAG